MISFTSSQPLIWSETIQGMLIQDIQRQNVMVHRMVKGYMQEQYEK